MLRWNHLTHSDMLASSRMTEKHLSLLNAQLRTVDPLDFVVVNYNELREGGTPSATSTARCQS